VIVNSVVTTADVTLSSTDVKLLLAAVSTAETEAMEEYLSSRLGIENPVVGDGSSTWRELKNALRGLAGVPVS
jgi:hypothetical protein|tara:strand:+ start:599 stop:817 length:219 start_codon:yes stop_codon:yes gene_type:complete